MPATDAALEAARTAADRYVDAVLARRRAYVTLPIDDPDSDDTLGRLREATRLAFVAFVESLDQLHARGGNGEALALILAVNERTTAARPPAEIAISEDDR